MRVKANECRRAGETLGTQLPKVELLAHNSHLGVACIADVGVVARFSDQHDPLVGKTIKQLGKGRPMQVRQGFGPTGDQLGPLLAAHAAAGTFFGTRVLGPTAGADQGHKLHQAQVFPVEGGLGCARDPH